MPYRTVRIESQLRLERQKMNHTVRTAEANEKERCGIDQRPSSSLPMLSCYLLFLWRLLLLAKQSRVFCLHSGHLYDTCEPAVIPTSTRLSFRCVDMEFTWRLKTCISRRRQNISYFYYHDEKTFLHLSIYCFTQLFVTNLYVSFFKYSVSILLNLINMYKKQSVWKIKTIILRYVFRAWLPWNHLLPIFYRFHRRAFQIARNHHCSDSKSYLLSQNCTGIRIHTLWDNRNVHGCYSYYTDIVKERNGKVHVTQC